MSKTTRKPFDSRLDKYFIYNVDEWKEKEKHIFLFNKSMWKHNYEGFYKRILNKEEISWDDVEKYYKYYYTDKRKRDGRHGRTMSSRNQFKKNRTKSKTRGIDNTNCKKVLKGYDSDDIMWSYKLRWEVASYHKDGWDDI